MSTIWGILSTAWSIGGTYGLAAIAGAGIYALAQKWWTKKAAPAVEAVEADVKKAL